MLRQGEPSLFALFVGGNEQKPEIQPGPKSIFIWPDLPRPCEMVSPTLLPSRSHFFLQDPGRADLKLIYVCQL